MATALLDPPPAPVDADGTRRELLTGALAVGVLLIGCGDDAQDTRSRPRDPGFPRTVEHPLGRTRIPARPARVVVVTNTSELDPVLASGARPVLAGTVGFLAGDDGILTPWSRAAGATSLERIELPGGQIPIERLAAARPDVIVGATGFVEGVAEQLGRIAPLVAVPDVAGGTWRDGARIVAETLGREAELAEQVAATEETINEARAALVDLRSDVTFLNLYGGTIGVRGSTSQEAAVLRDLGVRLAAYASTIEGADQELSAERLGELRDADVLLIEDFSANETEQLLALPLFARLPAVRERRVVRLSRDVTRAVYLPTVLSMRYAAPKLADAVLRAAAGRGDVLA